MAEPTSSASARSVLIRTAVIYTPLFLATLFAVLMMFFGGWYGGPVLLVLALIALFLFGYQSVQSLRDLREGMTRSTRGPVTRIWSKRDMFVTRSYYINVERAIFRIPVESYWDLREEAKRMRADGSDEDYWIEVSVEHYPHSGNVVALERLGVVPHATANAQRESADR